MGELTKSFEFDAAHRIMDEKIKCFNLHGHRFRIDLTLSYKDIMPIGYAVDFKLMKVLFGDWVDRYLDHACIANPMDKDIVDLCTKKDWRLYKMGFGVHRYVNPTAENLCSELFCIAGVFFDNENVEVTKVRVYETPTCFVELTQPMYYLSDLSKSMLKDWAQNKLQAFSNLGK